jgi:hypothetical protein
MNNTDEYNIYEYYDNMTNISVVTRDALNTLDLAREKIRLALAMISDIKNHGGNIAISPTPVTHLTINDVHRDLLFFELSLNQTRGVINTLTFQELLELTSYLTDEEEP